MSKNQKLSEEVSSLRQCLDALQAEVCLLRKDIEKINDIEAKISQIQADIEK
ncbi:hypothetical protein [Alkalihalobacterium alkalinitrilicum]|uniref:hypothetical protein n=1 Tax=Alkalihalobacterium alkalinitrilicum TaxID=427920 RepID=UPI0013033DBA|nr:hypothetical protein [Alkalihalobacterium alkalinitrilicum]